jgi:hypothetical protein
MDFPVNPIVFLDARNFYPVPRFKEQVAKHKALRLEAAIKRSHLSTKWMIRVAEKNFYTFALQPLDDNRKNCFLWSGNQILDYDQDFKFAYVLELLLSHDLPIVLQPAGWMLTGPNADALHVLARLHEEDESVIFFRRLRAERDVALKALVFCRRSP